MVRQKSSPERQQHIFLSQIQVLFSYLTDLSQDRYKTPDRLMDMLPTILFALLELCFAGSDL